MITCEFLEIQSILLSLKYVSQLHFSKWMGFLLFCFVFVFVFVFFFLSFSLSIWILFIILDSLFFLLPSFLTQFSSQKYLKRWEICSFAFHSSDSCATLVTYYVTRLLITASLLQVILDKEKQVATVDREVDDGIETVSLDLPAVIT